MISELSIKALMTAISLGWVTMNNIYLSPYYSYFKIYFVNIKLNTLIKNILQWIFGVFK